ncbi:RNA demethylase ALKBH9B [Triticum aestivum]|uniref:RNA demethylase ALKBH9B n=1 Tax=Triticum aestivum TaxID=4565 RepID=UPI001D020A3D|nr:RNA demethylase ALKBH9B-like [Triticum aestivum]
MSTLLPGEGMARVRRKKDFRHMERVDGRMLNVLQGLELHANVFSPDEQAKIVTCVLDLQDQGRRGRLRERTYSEPRKWMRGKGRATIQFGCCYNYAADRDANPPGIVRDESVDPLPLLLAAMARRLVLWRVLPPTCVPDSCIVNVVVAALSHVGLEVEEEQAQYTGVSPGCTHSPVTIPRAQNSSRHTVVAMAFVVPQQRNAQVFHAHDAASFTGRC